MDKSEGPGCGAGGRRRDLDGIRTVTTNPTGVEGAGGIGGSGCGARGRRQGLAGLRDDAPSRRLAARTASGRAAAHGHAQQPGTPVGHARNSRGPKRRSASGPTLTCVSCSQVELNVAAGDGLDQLARVVLDGVVEQFVGGVGLDELALLHDDDVVGDLADDC